MPRAGQQVAATEWKKHKMLISGLYSHTPLTLKTICRLLLEEHRFSASEAQYKRKLKEWGIRRNLKASECNAIGNAL
jgi:transposase